MKSTMMFVRLTTVTAGTFLGSTIGAGAAHAAVLIEAHRGDSLNAPENTLASINGLGGIADLTEFDVRLSDDNQLVLMHDSTLDRTTNGTGYITNQTLAQLKTLDAGSWFSSEFAGERIPTMVEAMDAALAIGVTPLVERKRGTAADFHAAFTAQGYDASSFRVISFDWDFIQDLNALDTNYQLGVLGSGGLDAATIATAAGKGADFIDWKHNTITATEVALVQGSGMELHVYTVDDESRMQELIDLGVDGITTNDPRLLATLIPEPGTLSLLALGAVAIMRRRRACWKTHTA